MWLNLSESKVICVQTLQWSRSKCLGNCRGTTHTWLLGADICRALRVVTTTTTVKLKIRIAKYWRSYIWQTSYSYCEDPWWNPSAIKPPMNQKLTCLHISTVLVIIIAHLHRFAYCYPMHQNCHIQALDPINSCREKSGREQIYNLLLRPDNLLKKRKNKTSPSWKGQLS